MKPTEDLVKLCLDELSKRSDDLQKYKDYYEGRHDILTDYDMQDCSHRAGNPHTEFSESIKKRLKRD